MKKILLASLIAIFIQLQMHATVQENDKIIYKGLECELAISRTCLSSPLYIYFQKNADKKYPFEPISTGNYRGHIATWEIRNEKLYLTKVETERVDEKDPSNWITEKVDIKNIFPENMVMNEIVFAGWFSGYMLILADPSKEWFDAPYGKEKYYVRNFKKYVIVRIENGSILEEHPFLREEYWELVRDYNNYVSHAPQEIALIRDYKDFLNGPGGEEPTEQDNKVMHTERDFELFLNRYVIREIRIPLTEYNIVTDATVDLTLERAILKEDLKFKKGSFLLILVMDSATVPGGPWERYSQGWVYVLVKLDRLKPMRQTLGRNVKFINMFARFQSPQAISGEIVINRIENEYAILSGNILLTSSEPSTRQAINLDNNKILIYSLEQYLNLEKNSE